MNSIASILKIYMQQYHLKRLFIFLATFLAITDSCCRAQDMKAYEGHWESPLPNDRVFDLTVGIRQVDDSTAVLILSGPRSSVSRTFHFVNGQDFAVSVDSNLTCKGTPDISHPWLRVFMQSGQWQYHLVLRPSGLHQFTGKWNILLVDRFSSPFYLSIEDPDGEQY